MGLKFRWWNMFNHCSSSYKSDHYGIEISVREYVHNHLHTYKSDHYGIEISLTVLVVFESKMYKSDHYGIEINLLHQRSK